MHHVARFAVFLALAVPVAGLVGCADDGSSGGTTPGSIFFPTPTYGAIAVSQGDGAAGITANYSSQRRANDEAVNQCRSGITSGVGACIVVLEYESNRCGALARSAISATMGWASDRSRSDARAKAVNECTNRGGIACSVVLQECND